MKEPLHRKSEMANVFDVAAYILDKQGPVTTWKLQKLVYYCQCWSLVWDDDELFPEEIEAWANGPVCRELYTAHVRRFRLRSSVELGQGSPDVLTKDQRDTVDSVLNYYGNESPQYLSDLTHTEDPWKNARSGIPDHERGNKIIPKEHMAEYYSSLPPDPD